MNTLIQNIVQQLKDIQTGKNWFGNNFEQKLALVDEKSAFIRPISSMHSVAEIISHLTVWRKETVQKISTGQGSLTDESEANWLSNSKLKAIGWEKIQTDYSDSLTTLITLLETKNDDFLSETYFDIDFKDIYEYKFVIYGMLHHDIYHLGQLGIIIKHVK